MHCFLLTIRAGIRGIGFQPVMGIRGIGILPVKTVPRQSAIETRSQWQLVLTQSVVLLATMIICSGANADDHFDAIDDYLTDDVAAVAYLDIASIDPDAILALCDQLGFVAEEERADIKKVTVKIDAKLSELTQAGIRYVYVLLRASDVNTGGPVWIVPVASGKLDLAEQGLQNILTEIPQLQSAIQSIQARDNLIVAGASEIQVKQAMSRPKLKRDLSTAWQALGTGSAGLIVFGDPDSRRVVREMFPVLPAPFESVTGDLLADDLSWGGIELTFPPKLKVKIEIESANSATSKVVSEALRNGLEKLGAWSQVQSLLPEADRNAILNSLNPVVDDTRTTVAFDPITDDLERLANVLGPFVRQTRSAATLQGEMNHVRQLAIAMHNYHDVYRHLPNPNGRSDKTPAGLSWRVHVLPFLGEVELWKQFKLDEPWDSPHNLPLVKQMPAIYRSPLTTTRAANQQGKTTYQVPFANEALFAPGEDSPSLMKITDGTSNTIMIVATLPQDAVIWTQPDDWKVNLDDPSKGFGDGKGGSIVAAFADASIHAIPATIEPEVLRADHQSRRRSGSDAVLVGQRHF